MSDCIYGGPDPRTLNPAWENHSFDWVICLINGVRKQKIESRYLQKIGSTKDEYLERFPGAPLICEKLRLIYSERTPARIATRSQTMKALNANTEFQSKRMEGVLSFLASEQSDPNRLAQSLRAKLQHQNGLSETIREKHWSVLTPEKRKTLNQWKTIPFEQFVDRARSIHGDFYQYSAVSYAGLCNKTIITCPRHGSFRQIGANHLHGANCPQCSNFISNMENLWLDSLGITERQKYIPLKPIRKRGAIVDGYDSSTNTVYQFHGDFWHGNPEIYDPDEWNPRTKCSFGTLYQTTLMLDAAIANAGYSIITMWENEWLSKRSSSTAAPRYDAPSND